MGFLEYGVDYLAGLFELFLQWVDGECGSTYLGRIIFHGEKRERRPGPEAVFTVILKGCVWGLGT